MTRELAYLMTKPDCPTSGLSFLFPQLIYRHKRSFLCPFVIRICGTCCWTYNQVQLGSKAGQIALLPNTTASSLRSTHRCNGSPSSYCSRKRYLDSDDLCLHKLSSIFSSVSTVLVSACKVSWPQACSSNFLARVLLRCCATWKVHVEDSGVAQAIW